MIQTIYAPLRREHERVTLRNTLQHTESYCNILQHTVRCCNMHLFGKSPDVWRLATHCNTLHHTQHTATHRNTPQQTATRCNTPQHTTSHHVTPQHAPLQQEHERVTPRAAARQVFWLAAPAHLYCRAPPQCLAIPVPLSPPEQASVICVCTYRYTCVCVCVCVCVPCAAAMSCISRASFASSTSFCHICVHV